jgi:3-oxoacyl-[acyl-carrier-protein] synthase-3
MPDRMVLLRSVGHYHPPHAIPNSFFDSLNINSAAAWVSERTGINQRFSVLPPEQLAGLRHQESSFFALKQQGKIPGIGAMSVAPWQMTRQRARLPADYQPDLLVCGTSVPDYDIPANAAIIAQELELTRPMVFDANSACSSFITDLRVASSLLRTSDYHSAAIFNVERYSLRLNYEDRSSCVLFGDGAACALLQKVERAHAGKEGFELVDIRMHSNPSGADLVQIPVMGLFAQQGARVQKFAISKTCQVASELLAAHGLNAGDLAYFIGHQANLRMLESCVQKLGLSSNQHLYNVDTHGNQGAAGAPCVLSQNWLCFNSGDLVLIAVVGSGLTWGGALLRKL